MAIFRPMSGIVSDLLKVPTRLFASLRGFLLLLLLSLCLRCEGYVVLSFVFESSLSCSLSLSLSLVRVPFSLFSVLL